MANPKKPERTPAPKIPPKLKPGMGKQAAPDKNKLLKKTNPDTDAMKRAAERQKKLDAAKKMMDKPKSKAAKMPAKENLAGKKITLPAKKGQTGTRTNMQKKGN